MEILFFVAAFVACGIVLGLLVNQGNSAAKLEAILYDSQAAISIYKKRIADLEVEREKRFKQLTDTHTSHNAHCNSLIEEYDKIIDDWKRIVNMNDETLKTNLETIRLNKETIKGYVDLVDRLKQRVSELENEISGKGEEWRNPKNKKKCHPEDDPDFTV